MDEDLLGFRAKVAMHAGLNLEEVLNYVFEGLWSMLLVLLPDNIDGGSYHLQNLESSEPLRRLLGQLIVKMVF